MFPLDILPQFSSSHPAFLSPSPASSLSSFSLHCGALQPTGSRPARDTFGGGALVLQVRRFKVLRCQREVMLSANMYANVLHVVELVTFKPLSACRGTLCWGGAAGPRWGQRGRAWCVETWPQATTTGWRPARPARPSSRGPSRVRLRPLLGRYETTHPPADPGSADQEPVTTSHMVPPRGGRGFGWLKQTLQTGCNVTQPSSTSCWWLPRQHGVQLPCDQRV